MATYQVPAGYATIQAALNAAGLAEDPVAIINVAAGTYNEALDFRTWAGGSSLLPATLQGADPENPPILDGTAVASQGVRMDLGRVPAALGTTPVFQDLIFENYTAGNGIIYVSNGPEVIVRRCLFRDSTSRVIRNITYLTTPSQVYDCYFLATGTAVQCATDVAVEVRNCVIAPNVDTNAVNVSSLNADVDFCSIYTRIAASAATSLITGDAFGTIVSNLAAATSARGISALGTRTNCITFGTFGAVNTGADGGGNLATDPLFVDITGADPNTYDLELQGTGSPAFNAAGVGDGGTALDVLGVARPQSTSWDIGAYEFEVTTTITDATASSTGASTSRIVLTLGDVVTSDASWETEANYTVTSLGTGVAVTVATATKHDATTIWLDTSEHTTGQPYNVAWAGLLHVTSGNDNFTGAGAAPTLTSATMTAAKVVRLVWAVSMTNNAALTTAANYVITDGSITPATVTRINATTVDLTFADRLPLAEATVRVNGPQDLALNPAANADADFSVPYLTLVSAAQDGPRGLTATFNVPPSSGYASGSDWSVVPQGLGATTSVIEVDPGDGTTMTLTCGTTLTIGAVYRVTSTAANASGPIG